MADFDVFDVLPEIPIKETWEFKTDVIVSYDGSEQRIALMDNPRVYMALQIGAASFDQRRSLYHTLSQAILTAYAVPHFQYAAPLTADASSGQPRVFFNPALTNIRAGQEAVLYNVRTGATEKFTVTTVEADGATFSTNLANDQAQGLVVCVPAPSSMVKDGSGFQSFQNSASVSLNIDPIEMWALQRPGASVSLTTFDSLTVLDKQVAAGGREDFEYRREVLDGGVGKLAIATRDAYLKLKRRVEFYASRQAGDMDYWREFFATVRGGQVSFLLSTQTPDLTLTSTPSGGATELLINEAATYVAYLFPNDVFKRIVIQYGDGTAATRHTVTAATPTSITISPAISSTDIAKISFLQRVRASDKVSLEHLHDETKVSFVVSTVDD